MKKKIIISAAFAFALTCAPHAAPASYLDKFIGVISQGTAAEKICRKASLFGGVFSIRSFEGRACSIKLIGAFAETVCPGISNNDNYMSSQCHGIAMKALGGEDAKLVLAKEINKISSSSRNAFCAKAGNVNPALSVACAKASTMKPETGGTTTSTVPSASEPLKGVEKEKAIADITQEQQKLETLQQELQQAPQIGVQPGKTPSQGTEAEHKAKLLQAAKDLAESMKGLNKALEAAKTGHNMSKEEIQSELEKAKTVENEVVQNLK